MTAFRLINLIWCQSGLALECITKPFSVTMQPLTNYSHQRFLVLREEGEGNEDEWIAYLMLDTKSIESTLQVVGDDIILSKWTKAPNQQWRITLRSSEEVFIQPVVDLGKVLVGADQIGQNIALRSISEDASPKDHWRMVSTSCTLFRPFDESELQKFTLSFDCIESQLKLIIAEYGFCVIDNLLPADEVDEALALWGQDLMDVLDMEALLYAIEHSPDEKMRSRLAECLTRLQQAEPSSIPKLWPSYRPGRWDYSAHSLCHASMPWKIRLNNRVRKVFSVLYDGIDFNSMVVGMDAIFFSPMSSSRGDEDLIWGHADMNLFKDGVADWSVYQAIVSLWPQHGYNSSTTVVWPKSHTDIFDTLMKADGLDSCHQFVKLEHIAGLEGSIIRERYIREARRVPMAPGSMIVFNSKLTHQGWNRGPRLAVPVCWEPKVRRDPAIARNRKIRLAASGLPSTHWASLGRQHGLTQDVARESRPLSLKCRDTVQDAIDCIDLPIIGIHPPSTLKPYTDFVNTVIPICDQLSASNDSDCELANQLSTLLHPHILESL